ncbi:hypothetical protein M0R45_011083 [Rubus argutus]|uniref:Uncharacterized protein n=1 Tax=Rubus argutus TaxID=59490 RepID=A0AAW1Y8Z1_RUBAR
MASFWSSWQSPAMLPGAPLSSSPAVSPDISPLFPSPSSVPLSPSESSLPTIPSSPSPPNPEATVAAPEPELAVSPSGSPLPSSHSVSVTSSSMPLHVIFFLGLLVFVQCRFLVFERFLGGTGKLQLLCNSGSTYVCKLFW